MLVGYSVVTTSGNGTISTGVDCEKVNEMKDLKVMAPVTLLLVLVIAAMGVMVFWGLSLLDLPG